ncbi:MAG: MBL fold metallo-hydrolase [Syntrophomonadaceae bacterium]|jgi:phosphoribosyl 1,2-cyclic phosphodiesterase
MIKIHILASGSTGNAALFQFGPTSILIDAGISARRIAAGLKTAGSDVQQLDAVLLTHEHSDHIKGVEVLARRHQVPVYARIKTWECLPFQDNIPLACCQVLNDAMNINSVEIECFPICHDAIDPVGFTFRYRGRKLVFATDIGTVTGQVIAAFSDADAAVLEANHDREMLAKGPYPRFLKERISGGQGHLSNDHSARILAQSRLKPGLRVFLAHLSQQNNDPDLAENTVARYLTQQGCDVGREIILYQTYPQNVVKCWL